MLITFRSQASGDVMMFGDIARQMLKVVGKDPADKGIITVAQLPDAIAALKSAIAADKATRTDPSTSRQMETEAEQGGSERLFVSTSQHAHPLLDLFEWSLKDDKPVLWEG